MRLKQKRVSKLLPTNLTYVIFHNIVTVFHCHVIFYYSKMFTTNWAQIFVQGLPHDVRESEIKQYFSSVGEIKNDKLTKKDRIWLYKDKNTGRPLGECTITYRNTETQQKALQHYHGEYFQGCKLDVTPRDLLSLRQNT